MKEYKTLPFGRDLKTGSSFYTLTCSLTTVLAGPLLKSRIRMFASCCLPKSATVHYDVLIIDRSFVIVAP
jgi:hypothetical protein